jgi:hypothetical protein
MKRFFLTVAALTLSAGACAAPVCSAIKGSAARLACYDKAAAEAPVKMDPMPAPFPTTTASKGTPPKGEVFKSGMWTVVQDTNPMNDKRTCTSIYKNAWTLQGSNDTLFLSLRGRGGVSAITMRIDEAQPLPMRLATESEKNISAANFQGEFAQIYQAKRLRVQILTVLHSVVNEDVDLTGFKEATDYMRANCQA